MNTSDVHAGVGADILVYELTGMVALQGITKAGLDFLNGLPNNIGTANGRAMLFNADDADKAFDMLDELGLSTLTLG